MNEDQLQDLLVRGYDSAPPHIQKFIQDGKVGAFVMSVQGSAQLHADVADDVSNQILLTLLGVLSPAELPDTLKKEVGLSDAQIATILNEANKTIFIPLRDELSKNQPSKDEGDTEIPEGRFEPLEEIPERKPLPSPTQPKSSIPAPSYAPPVAPQTPSGPLYDFSQPAGPIQSAPAPSVMTSAPVPPPAPTPVAFTPAPQNPPVPVVLPEPTPVMASEAMEPQRPTMRTMVSDVEQMKHGQAPHAYMRGSVPTFTQTPVSQPVPTMAPRETASVPSSQPTHTPPPAIHVTPPPYIPPVAQPPSQTPVPTHPPRRPEPTAEEVTHSLKQYGIDPYREPIE